VEELSRAEGEALGDQPAAQLLQFQSRSMRQFRSMLEKLERMHAAALGERIGAAQAADRVQASLATARRAREQLQERLAAARREHRQRRERAEDDAQDDRGRPLPDADE
jgi:hypothetical protein